MATTIATRIRIRTVTRTRTLTRTVTATHTRRTANAAADMDDVQALLQTLANIQTPFRIASSARPARTRTSCCSAMAATRGITPIASSPKWTTYPMAIGEYNKKKEKKMNRRAEEKAKDSLHSDSSSLNSFSSSYSFHLSRRFASRFVLFSFLFLSRTVPRTVPPSLPSPFPWPCLALTNVVSNPFQVLLWVRQQGHQRTQVHRLWGPSSCARGQNDILRSLSTCLSRRLLHSPTAEGATWQVVLPWLHHPCSAAEETQCHQQ